MRTLYTILLATFAAVLYGQQLPLFGQYRELHALVNPASLSTDYWGNSTRGHRDPFHTAGLTYRKQWHKLPDGPVTMSAHYEVVVPKLNCTFGGTLLSDRTGPTGLNGGQLRYAYQPDIGRDQLLSIGISAGFYEWAYRADRAILRDPGDVVGLATVRTGLADANVGVFYERETQNNDILYGGLSALQVLSVKFSDERVQRVPHIYAHGGLYKFLGGGNGDDGEFYFEPSFWVKYAPNTPLQTDLNARFYTPVGLWVGTGYAFAVGGPSPNDDLTKKEVNFQGVNLQFETGYNFIDPFGQDEDRVLRLGFVFNRTFTRYGGSLGNTYEMNLKYAWEGQR